MDLRLIQQPTKQISLNLTLNVQPGASMTEADVRKVAAVVIVLITDELGKH